MKTVLDCNLDIIYTDCDETDATKLLIDIRKKFINNGSLCEFLYPVKSHPTYFNARYVIHSSDEEVVIEYLPLHPSALHPNVTDSWDVEKFNQSIVRRSIVNNSIPFMALINNMCINSYPSINTACLLCTNYDLVDGHRICKECDKDYDTYIRNRCCKVILLMSWIDAVEDVRGVIKRTYVSIIKKRVPYKFGA
jgi:hypothetical protein